MAMNAAAPAAAAVDYERRIAPAPTPAPADAGNAKKGKERLTVLGFGYCIYEGRMGFRAGPILFGYCIYTRPRTGTATDAKSEVDKFRG